MLPYRERLEERLSSTVPFVSVNYRRTAGEMAASHWHPCYELLFVFGGEAMQEVDGRKFPLRAGDTLLITSGAVHATSATEEDCYIGVMAFLHPRPLPTIRLAAGGCPEMERIFSRIQEECTLRRPGSEAIVQGLLLQALGLLERHGSPLAEPAPGPGNGEGRRIEEYLRANLSRGLTLRSVADFAGYSPAYLSRRFSDMMGMPFKQYVDRMKLQAARGLLADGFTAGETALALGYETPSSFCRAFKRLTGQTPSEYQAAQKMDKTR